MKTKRGNSFKPGDRVRVYRNLHLGRDVGVKFYSVVRDGRVVGHVSSILLRDVEFRVQPAGRDRVRRTGRKNVHAFVVGTVVNAAAGVTKLGTLPVSIVYNPKLDEHFRWGRIQCLGGPHDRWVFSARVAVVNQSGITAIDIGESELVRP